MGNSPSWSYACTRPTDRVLAVGYLQELYFLSARGFAGGQVWIRPHYFTGSEDQRTVIEGIAAHPVPIVFEPPEPVYTADYAASFPALDAFLRSRYEDRGTFDFGRDVLPAMVNAGRRVYAYEYGGYWEDVGTVESYWRANLDLLSDHPGINLFDRPWLIYTKSEERAPTVTSA